MTTFGKDSRCRFLWSVEEPSSCYVYQTMLKKHGELRGILKLWIINIPKSVNVAIFCSDLVLLIGQAMHSNLVRHRDLGLSWQRLFREANKIIKYSMTKAISNIAPTGWLIL